jgi:DNA repair protein RecN (Recombination protein N)
MLIALKIKNYALLKDVEIDFGPGLNILTGETGAGKSILIGAINTAIGERGYIENIRTGEDKAVVEAVFDFSSNADALKNVNELLSGAGIEPAEPALVIRREISRSSKGRILINNSNATLSFLEKLGKGLVDIHGQHEHQSLLRAEIHMDLLDAYAGCGQIKAKTTGLYTEYNGIMSELDKLRSMESEKAEKLEMVNFRLNELENAALGRDSELDELNSERSVMVHAESVKASVVNVINMISPSSLDQEGDGAIDLVYKAKQSMDDISKIDAKSMSQVTDLVSEATIKLEEIREFFVSYRDKIEFDPARLTEAEDRISLIESLMKKYKKSGIKELKQYQEELLAEKKAVEFNSEAIKDKEKLSIKCMEALAKASGELSAIRHKKAKELGARIEEELKDLGILKASFNVAVEDIAANEGDLGVIIGSVRYKVTSSGINNVEFMISLNPGEDLKPLVKIASGGEISRIMLSIKNILSAVDPIPVMVFDEIDTGISGKIAQVVGKKLREISSKKQLLCITHLPQIAAFSDTHYSVGKYVADGKTETRIVKLDKQAKVREVAKLLSGETVTDTSLKAAQELIDSVSME